MQYPTPTIAARLSFAGAAVVGVAACGVVYANNPYEQSIFMPCPTLTTFGVLCAGCGGTRALHFLLHGDLLNAFSHNAAFVVLLPFVALIAWRWLRFSIDPTRYPFRLDMSTRAVWTLLVGIGVFSVIRNVPGLEVLAPHVV